MAEAPQESPFEVLNKVGCRNEQIIACLRLLSSEILDESEIAHENGGRAQGDRLYGLFLILEVVRRDFEQTDSDFRAAEKTLYQAGIPRQFETELTT